MGQASAGPDGESAAWRDLDSDNDGFFDGAYDGLPIGSSDI